MFKIFGIVLSLCAVIISPVFAHTTETSGPIRAILHVHPSDDPVVGASAYFYFNFSDKENKLDLRTCDCTLSIKNGTSTVVSKKVVENEEFDITKTTIGFNYIFPEKGLYIATVEGKGTESDSRPFIFSYRLPVERDSASGIPLSERIVDSHIFHELHIGHFIIFAGAILVGIFLSKRKTKAL